MTTLLFSLLLTSQSVSQQPEIILPVPLPPPPVVVPDRPPTLDEFIKTFEPLPGVYKVCVIHPVSKKAVEVCFHLPEGCPKVNRCCNRVHFDYGKHEVTLIFRIGGKVDVRYD